MERLLTTTEAAARLGVAAVTVRLRCRAGDVPGAVQVGRDWVIPESALKGFKRRPRGNPNWVRKGEAE